MIVRYSDGTSVDGVLLARDGNRMRAALRTCDDVSEFTEINGVWVSEDCEPVGIEFAWQKKSKQAAVTEADCICSPELAAHLIQLLWSGEPAEAPRMPALAPEYGAQSARLAS